MSDTRSEAIELMIKMMERVRQCLSSDSASAEMELDTLKKALAENFGNIGVSNEEVDRQIQGIMKQRETLSRNVADSDKKVEVINVVLELFSKKKKVVKKAVSRGTVQKSDRTSIKVSEPDKKLFGGYDRVTPEELKEISKSQTFRNLAGTDKLVFLIGLFHGQNSFYVKSFTEQVKPYARLNYDYMRCTVSWMARPKNGPLSKTKPTDMERKKPEHVSGAGFKYRLNAVRGTKKFNQLFSLLVKEK